MVFWSALGEALLEIIVSRSLQNTSPSWKTPPGGPSSPRATTGSPPQHSSNVRRNQPGKVSGRCRANGNANVPVGFARHVSRAEEDLGVPEKGVPARNNGRAVLCLARAHSPALIPSPTMSSPPDAPHAG